MKMVYHSDAFNIHDYPKLTTKSRILNFSKWELIASAFTVGRKNRWDVVSNGPYSLYEMMYRSTMILANLEMKPKDFLVQSKAYKSLDPSEKSAISYFLGLTISKLMADKLMGVPYLMHLEVYQIEIIKKYGPIVYKTGKSRPDLIGFNSNLDPFIFEAKGRSGNFDSGAFKKAKKQAGMVASIGSPAATPKAAVAVISYFNQKKELMAKWKDPLPEPEGLNYDFISAFDVIKKYYKPFFDLRSNFDFDEVYSGYHSVNLPMLDLTLHLPRAIERILESAEMKPTEIKEILNSIPEVNLKIDGDDSDYLKSKNKDIFKNTHRIAIMNDKIIFEFGKSWNTRFFEN